MNDTNKRVQILEKRLHLLRQAVAPIVRMHRYGNWTFAGREFRALTSVYERTSSPRKQP